MKDLQVVGMTTKTILLIHKDPNIGEVIQACLTDLAGWNVRVASSTLEGLRQASLYQPDAIILEISVGEIDGLLFLKQLRAQPATQGIPVLLLTFKAKWSDLQKSWFQKYQVTPVIVNPLDPAMLAVEIAKVLGWDLDF
jgi:DNA-binding response OmpR family regulator